MLALLDPEFATASLGRGCSFDGGCSGFQGKWKQRLMSFADTKTAHFLKNMYILSDLHATESNFLAKFLLSFDHWRILVVSVSNSTIFLNSFRLCPLIFFSISTGKWWVGSKTCYNSEKNEQLLCLRDVECHISKGGQENFRYFHIGFLKELGVAVFLLYF